MSLIFADVTQFTLSFENFYRSTTLNDIYRTLSMNRQHTEEVSPRRQDDKYIDDAADSYKDYDEGDVTGFMVEKPLTSSGTNSFDVSSNSVLSALNSLTWKTMQFLAISNATSTSRSQNRLMNNVLSSFLFSHETLLVLSFGK